MDVADITVNNDFSVNDVDVEAFDLQDASKQCVVAILNMQIFPITYQLVATSCEESNVVICQTSYGMNIG